MTQVEDPRRSPARRVSHNVFRIHLGFCLTLLVVFVFGPVGCRTPVIALHVRGCVDRVASRATLACARRCAEAVDDDSAGRLPVRGRHHFAVDHPGRDSHPTTLLYTVRDGMLATVPQHLTDSLVMLMFVFIPSASLHSSMSTLTEPQWVEVGDLSRIRLSGIGFIVVVPIAVTSLVHTGASAHTRSDDLVCRIGGDEFVIALASPSHLRLAEALANRLLAEFAQPFRLSVGDVVVSASIGVVRSFGGAHALELIRDADTAMYKAKGSGRNGYALFDSALRDQVRDRLEITESGVMEDIETALASLNALKALGITLCVDDFGTGYSSLSYPHRLPCGIVKIDRSFISDVDDNGANEPIVRAVLAMTKAMGQRVVAEGVETVVQRDWLRAQGCELVQGWFYGKADLPANLDNWIHRRVPADALEST